MDLLFSLHGNITEGGLKDGLLHPITGMDHLLAMLCIGIVSTLLNNKHLYLLPTAFVASMIGGGILGFKQYPIYFTEIIISLSVVILGFMILFVNKNSPAFIIYLATFLFGTSHGYAHGIEMPFASHANHYIAGFAFSTSSIHILGIFISKYTAKIMEGKFIKTMAIFAVFIF
jgi:urease accessory protein